MSTPVTAASGISWEVLVAILTPFAVLGMAAAGFLWRAITASTASTIAAIEKLDTKIEDVATEARASRAKIWTYHHEQRDKLTTLQARFEATRHHR